MNKPAILSAFLAALCTTIAYYRNYKGKQKRRTYSFDYQRQCAVACYIQCALCNTQVEDKVARFISRSEGEIVDMYDYADAAKQIEARSGPSTI